MDIEPTNIAQADTTLKKPPKVSVCVVTYNHEKYISQCLQSLVDQVTNFDFEIIVGEDCSTDGTRAIVERFSREFPHKIRPLFHEKNIGAIANYMATHSDIRSEYIAHIDGDDYVLPGKLQAQYDILSNNPMCMICTHDVIIVDESGKIVKNSFNKKKTGVYTLVDLYKELPFFAHSSKMYRNVGFESLNYLITNDTLDIDIHVAHAKIGHIYHFNKCYGAYREMVGVSNSGDSVNTSLVNGTRRIYRQALHDSVYDKDLILKFYSRSILNYCYQSLLLRNIPDALVYLNESKMIKKHSMLQVILEQVIHFPNVAMKLACFRSSIQRIVSQGVITILVKKFTQPK